jgi:hypothetical protein
MPKRLACHCGRPVARSQPYRLERRLGSMCFACAKASCDESMEVCAAALDFVSTVRAVRSANRWRIDGRSGDSRSRAEDLEPKEASRRIA